MGLATDSTGEVFHDLGSVTPLGVRIEQVPDQPLQFIFCSNIHRVSEVAILRPTVDRATPNIAAFGGVMSWSFLGASADDVVHISSGFHNLRR